MQNVITQAPVRPTKVPHYREKLQRPFRLILLPGQGFANIQVFPAVKQGAPRIRSVAPRPPRFLIIFFQTLGHIVIDDERDIALIDAHAVRAGSNYDLHLAVNKRSLRCCPLPHRQSGMVARDIITMLPQQPETAFHILMGRTINDAAFSFYLLQFIQQRPVFICRGFFGKKQIGAVKAAGNHHRVRKAQAADYILPYRGCSRGGKGRIQRPLRQQLHERPDLQIRRTEIVSPLGYAMGFVHHHKIRRAL